MLLLQLSSYSSSSALVPVAACGVKTKHFSTEEDSFLPDQQTQGLEVSDSFITLSSIFLYIYLPASDYGLFLSDEDPRKGIWLEAGRTLDYYMLRNGVCN